MLNNLFYIKFIFFFVITSTTSIASECFELSVNVVCGKQYYQEYCALCHGENADGNGRIAGNMKHPSPTNLILSSASDQYMREIIVKGGEKIIRSSYMPPWGNEFGAAQVSSLILYLKEIRQSSSFESVISKSNNNLYFQKWLIKKPPIAPENNKWNKARASLGKMLFFDKHLSRDLTISCASCHNPELGWSDGLSKSVGINGVVLKRSSPVITNAAYNYLQMWDGRIKSLENQALAPLDSHAEMHTDFLVAIDYLKNDSNYRDAFKKAYPDENITRETIAKALASFERTVVSNDSPFDQWIRGDGNAMSRQQIRGFKLFIDPAKGNCEICHSAPNFVDDGFHNIGLKSNAEGNDLGRYAIRKVKVLKSAFKTPTLRDIELSAPYFHDGSASTLMDVVEHYNRGGDVKEGLDPNMLPLALSQQEKEDLVEFLKALTTRYKVFVLPELSVN
ncbi:MAG: hypothetical protein DIZ80_14925 [endosymbiont of Galathealinum brachiosum]|uniref:Methylamine utilization protein MauG n=1 Tax=endosymbiont of Galathealinum brachiosum TaxID=2200906 RepID=A0A370D927_9GAMM|nr:MAG: hypothetical protein DIZ80_14925 [endosymbiont of Galathealinum brachiosum]